MFVRSVKETPFSSTVPSPWPAFNPNDGWGGTALSARPDPPICQRVTSASCGEDSTSLAFADRPVISTTSPEWFGIVN